MKRGGYSGDKKMELKFRSSPVLYETIKALAEQKKHNGGSDEGNGRTEAQSKPG